MSLEDVVKAGKKFKGAGKVAEKFQKNQGDQDVYKYLASQGPKYDVLTDKEKQAAYEFSLSQTPGQVGNELERTLVESQTELIQHVSEDYDGVVNALSTQGLLKTIGQMAPVTEVAQDEKYRKYLQFIAVLNGINQKDYSAYVATIQDEYSRKQFERALSDKGNQKIFESLAIAYIERTQEEIEKDLNSKADMRDYIKNTFSKYTKDEDKANAHIIAGIAYAEQEAT